MGGEMESVSMWAILPAPVRYDQVIPPNAKLLFAEIAAKANGAGYCYAGNKWFMERFAWSENSIRNLLAALEARGFVTTVIDNSQPRGKKRRIYLRPEAFGFASPPGENAATAGSNSVETCPPKIWGDTPQKFGGSIENNNNNKINPPISPDKIKWMPADVFNAIGEAAGDDTALLLAWISFAEFRWRKRKPITTVTGVKRLAKKLEALSAGNAAAKVAILNQSEDNGWTGLFALKEQGTPQGSDRPAERRRDIEWI